MEPVTIPDLQFSATYEAGKARRLVEDMRRLAGQLNRLIKAHNELAASIGDIGVGDHVLATDSGLGASHTVSGLTEGHVLKATSADSAAFARLGFGDMDRTDSAAFESPSNGDVLMFSSGFYTLAPISSVAGATSLASYLLATPEATLPNARIIADTATVSWDISVSGSVALDVNAHSITHAHLDRVYTRHFMHMGA